MAAQFTPDTASMKRRRARLRQRQPRLLFTQLGAIRPWSRLEAEVLRQLGPQFTAGVEALLPLTPEEGCWRTVLLLFSQHMLIAQVDARGLVESDSGGSRRHESRHSIGHVGGSSSSSASADRLNPRAGSWPQMSGAASGAAEGDVGGGSFAADVATVEPMDLFEALDESALKLFSQALKPINTLVYGVQDMEAQLSGKQLTESVGDPDISRGARRFPFEDLRSVDMLGGDVLQLEDVRGGIHSLPLASAPFGVAARQALADGFRAVLTSTSSVANWDRLNLAIQEERRQPIDGREREQTGQRASRGVGERVLEVFEVERLFVPTGEWKTPFMPMDRELSFRWVDATGVRHPHLLPELSCEQTARRTLPPCELDALFRPVIGWSIDIDDNTDENGWKYGLAWNSSTWDRKAGLFDAIRKRRWTRKYE
eukprot:TRINITY_DN25022_c0_g1_i3.p1 TRINITY_DN25022_c0_g1~~TRINITY_DN25022_c0_g1_i3.p1  ORF type:complete len:427 (-),score=71.42 TRINITY_DN25022_c0_g1_i3:61-1341(-)